MVKGEDFLWKRTLVKGRYGEGQGPVSGSGLRDLIPSARDSDNSYKHGIQACSLQTVRPQPGERENGAEGRGFSFSGTRGGEP